MPHAQAHHGFTYEASFDGIRMDVLSAQISHGRDVVAHTFPKRDGADLEDMGRRPFRCTMEFIFIDHKFATEEEGDAQQRFEFFNGIVNSGESRLLIHPYEGGVICKVEQFTHSGRGDQDGITCSAVFIEERSVPPVFVAGAGAPERVSSQEVNADVITTDAALSDAKLTSTVTPDVTTTVEEWEVNPDLSARQVQLEMATLNNRLNAELEDFDVLTDISKHPIHLQYTRLQYTIRRASEAFTTTTSRIIKLVVTEPTPLRVVAARFYGAVQAERRFDEMRDLNPDLQNPLLVPRNTELKAYSPAAESQKLRQ